MAEERESAELEEITGQPAEAGGQEGGAEGKPTAEGGEPPAGEGEGASATTETAEPERKQTPKWAKDRFDKLTRQKTEADRRAEAAETERKRLADQNERLRKLYEADGKAIPGDEAPQKPQGGRENGSADDIERRAGEIAANRAREQQVAKDSARVMSEGAKTFGADKWETARKDFVDNFGQEAEANPAFFDAIFGIENGHEVFYKLASDPDEAARVLALPPARLGLEIGKLAAQPKPERRVSAAPAPLTPVNGGARVAKSLTDDDISMDDWIALREEQLAKRA